MPRSLKLQKNSPGQVAEDLACRLLISKGYKIVTRNFKSRFGEIDIITRDSETLVFVEVKARWSQKFGVPEESVTPQKIYRIKKTADYYCLTNSIKDKKMRIDVVALELKGRTITSSKIIHVY